MADFTPLLDVQQLRKDFNVHHLAQTVPAFRDLSFRLDRGAFLLISGTNGAGKSTLLRTLYRSYRPVSGRIWYQHGEDRIDLARAADIDIVHLRRTDIGFATQFLNARPRVSAEDIVAEPLRATGRSPADAREQARHWLEAFGVKRALWPAYPSTFSGGEQQKVNLARTLIVPRRLLLLDEPTASLDAGAREALVGRLAELKTKGVAMIGVFHHRNDIAPLIDNEIRLREIRREQRDVA